MQKKILILILIFHSTINTADHTKTSLSNENTKRTVESFTEKPQPQKPSPKRQFPFTFNRTEYQYFAQTIQFNPKAKF